MVCWGINKMKQDLSQSQFLNFCIAIANKEAEKQDALLSSITDLAEPENQ
jgi:hypothetical protein